MEIFSHLTRSSYNVGLLNEETFAWTTASDDRPAWGSIYGAPLGDSAPNSSNKPSSVPDPRLVQFWFVTDRVPVLNSLVPEHGQSIPRNVAFTGDRQTKLTYGAAAVHIPKDHKIGRIEIPKGYSILGIDLFEESPNEDKHFIINHVATLSEQEWDEQLKAQKADTALVFVHGFNTTFEEALLRNAQIVFDLQFKGLSVLYSWSSRGGFENYRYDLDSAYSARAGFIKLLTKFRDDFHIKHVNVLAHSMGNILVLDSLVNSANSSNPVSLDQLIMAAPDVARDLFETQVSVIQKLCGGTTLYASGADKALALSKKLAVYPRAADVPDDGPVILPNMDTIDVTAIGDELLGFNHSEFATNRAVMDDIALLLNRSIHHPPRLTEVRPFPEPPKISTHWRYVP